MPQTSQEVGSEISGLTESGGVVTIDGFSNAGLGGGGCGKVSLRMSLNCRCAGLQCSCHALTYPKRNVLVGSLYSPC